MTVPGVTFRVWPKRLTRAVLRAAGVVNTFDTLRSGECGVYYRNPGPRDVMCKAWMVWRKGHPFKDEPWYNQGQKAFTTRGGSDRWEVLPHALSFAAITCRTAEWCRTPWGDYVPATALDRLLSRILPAGNPPAGASGDNPMPTKSTKSAKKSTTAKKVAAAEERHRERMAKKGKPVAAPPAPADASVLPEGVTMAEALTADPVNRVRRTRPRVAADAPAPAAPAPKVKAAHVRVFGRYSYCSTSRALGLRGYGTKEAELVFAALGITPAKNSVNATLRDVRLKPAELTDAEWKKLDRLREVARKKLSLKPAADVAAKAADLAVSAAEDPQNPALSPAE